MLQQKFNATHWIARISDVYYESVHCWIRPFDECHIPLHEAYHSGLQSGDTEFALYCTSAVAFMRFGVQSLPELEHDILLLLDRSALYGLAALTEFVNPYQQVVRTLMGPLCEINEQRCLIIDTDGIPVSGLLYIWTHAYRVFLFFLFGKYAEAMQQAKVGRKLAVPFFGPCRGSFAALIVGQRKRKRARNAKKYSKLLLRWSKRGEPRNFIGAHYLLEAELAALAGNKASSYILYVSAIATCREGKFLLQTAIATERAAKSLLEWDERELSESYLKDAIALYTDWGAMAKVQQLELEMHKLAV
jgi:hypothetical protein